MNRSKLTNKCQLCPFKNWDIWKSASQRVKKMKDLCNDICKAWTRSLGSCMFMMQFLAVTKGWFPEWLEHKHKNKESFKLWSVVFHLVHLHLTSVFKGDSPFIFIPIENDSCERKRPQSDGSRRRRARSPCSHCCYWRQQFHIHRFNGSTSATICEYFNIAGTLPESFCIKSAYLTSVLSSSDFLRCFDLVPRVTLVT